MVGGAVPVGAAAGIRRIDALYGTDAANSASRLGQFFDESGRGPAEAPGAVDDKLEVAGR